MRGRGRGRGGGRTPTPPTSPKVTNEVSASPASSTGSASQQQNASILAFQINSSSGGFGGPNFTTDILNHLTPSKRQEMLQLVTQFRSKQVQITEFMGQARLLLGEQLYSVLAAGMSAARGTGTSQQPQQQQQTGSSLHQSMPSFGTEEGASSASKGGGGDNEVDVSKLDTAALQDVIQYSGVDLKAEAEMIIRHDHFSSLSSAAANQPPLSKDVRVHYDYLFNSNRMKALISAAVMAKGIVDMSEDCLDMLGMAVRQRLLSAITDLIEISKHRVDVRRANYKIKVENDPRKQVWLVEQYMEAENERVRKGLGAFGSADALAMARAKMKKQERKSVASEDVAVKTKLANVTAAVATGLQQKSWMLDASSVNSIVPEPTPTDGPFSTVTSNNTTTSTSASTRTNSSSSLHFSQAPSLTPASDKDLTQSFASRTVNLKDLVYFTENDPHLRNSTFLLSLYSQIGSAVSPSGTHHNSSDLQNRY